MRQAAATDKVEPLAVNNARLDYQEEQKYCSDECPFHLASPCVIILLDVTKRYELITNRKAGRDCLLCVKSISYTGILRCLQESMKKKLRRKRI